MRDFKDFVTEARGHLLPGSGACANPAQCRTLNEILYIAYHRSKDIKKKLDLDNVYITSVQPKLTIDGTTKVLISAPALVGVDKKDVHGAPLFRICVPSDRSQKSYLDYRCPLMDCPKTLQEAKKCNDDPSVPIHSYSKK